jgi:hypothetical protein
MTKSKSVLGMVVTPGCREGLQATRTRFRVLETAMRFYRVERLPNATEALSGR